MLSSQVLGLPYVTKHIRRAKVIQETQKWVSIWLFKHCLSSHLLFKTSVSCLVCACLMILHSRFLWVLRIRCLMLANSFQALKQSVANLISATHKFLWLVTAQKRPPNQKGGKHILSKHYWVTLFRLLAEPVIPFSLFWSVLTALGTCIPVFKESPPHQT